MGRRKSSPIRFLLHVTVEEDSERNCFIAHCLEFDLVATAKTKREASEKMSVLLLGHIKYAVEKNLHPYSEIPERYWEKIKRGYAVRNEQSEIMRESENIVYDSQELCPA